MRISSQECIVFYTVLGLILFIPESARADPCDPGVYNALDDHRRDVNSLASSSHLCDLDLPTGWYRFFINGSDAGIPTTCVQPNSCGTQAPIWLGLDTPPTVGQEVTSIACSSWSGQGQEVNCCFYPYQVSVKNCGLYFVYQLGSSLACNIAYCAEIIKFDVPTTPTPFPPTTTTTITTTEIATTIYQPTAAASPPTTITSTQLTTTTKIVPRSTEALEVTTTSTETADLVGSTTPTNFPRATLSQTADPPIVTTISTSSPSPLSTITDTIIDNSESTGAISNQATTSSSYTFTNKTNAEDCPDGEELDPLSQQCFGLVEVKVQATTDDIFLACDVSSKSDVSFEQEVTWCEQVYFDSTAYDCLPITAEKNRLLLGDTVFTGQTIVCQVQDVSEADGKIFRSQPFFVGLQIKEKELAVSDNGTSSRLTLTSTIPVPCGSGFDSTYCKLGVNLLVFDTDGHYLPRVRFSTCYLEMTNAQCNASKCEELTVEMAVFPDPQGMLATRDVVLIAGITYTGPGSWAQTSVDKQIHVEESSFGSCHVVTDPHVLTFDGRVFDLYRTGTFILYYSSFLDFTVEIRVSPCDGHSTGSPRQGFCVCGLVVAQSDDVISVDNCHQRQRQGHVEVRYPLGAISQDVRVYKHETKNALTVVFLTGRRLRIYVETFGLNVALFLPSLERGRGKGLCGNYDNDPSNDFVKQNGAAVAQSSSEFLQALEFIESWRLQPSQARFDEPDLDWKEKLDLFLPDVRCDCSPSSAGDVCPVTPFFQDTQTSVISASDVTDEFYTHALFPDKSLRGEPDSGTHDSKKQPYYFRWDHVISSQLFLPTWPTEGGIQQEMADEACAHFLFQAPLTLTCADFGLVGLVVSTAFDFCKKDIQVKDDMSWANHSTRLLESVCEFAVLQRASNFTSITDRATPSQPVWPTALRDAIGCPVGCGRGQCEDGRCVCEEGVRGQACNIEIGEKTTSSSPKLAVSKFTTPPFVNRFTSIRAHTTEIEKDVMVDASEFEKDVTVDTTEKKTDAIPTTTAIANRLRSTSVDVADVLLTATAYGTTPEKISENSRETLSSTSTTTLEPFSFSIGPFTSVATPETKASRATRGLPTLSVGTSASSTPGQTTSDTPNTASPASTQSSWGTTKKIYTSDSLPRVSPSSSSSTLPISLSPSPVSLKSDTTSQSPSAMTILPSSATSTSSLYLLSSSSSSPLSSSSLSSVSLVSSSVLFSALPPSFPPVVKPTKTTPPTISRSATTSPQTEGTVRVLDPRFVSCDIAQERCTVFAFQGPFPQGTLRCRLSPVKIHSGVVQEFDVTVVTSSVQGASGQLMCVLPYISYLPQVFPGLDNNISTLKLEVSLAETNSVLQENYVTVFDSTCLTCDYGGQFGCELKMGYCYIDNTCYSELSFKPSDSCVQCVPAFSTAHWSPRQDNLAPVIDGQSSVFVFNGQDARLSITAHDPEGSNVTFGVNRTDASISKSGEFLWRASGSDGQSQALGEEGAELGAMRNEAFTVTAKDACNATTSLRLLIRTVACECAHAGVCENPRFKFSGEGSEVDYDCACADGFTGVRCEQEIDLCTPNPCSRGKCINHTNSFVCQCEDGFSGELCNVRQDPCESQPCFPNVTCSPSFRLESRDVKFVCGPCPAGYTGDGVNCVAVSVVARSTCPDQPCFPGVVCLDLPDTASGYRCGQCPRFFSGDGRICVRTNVSACSTGVCSPVSACAEMQVPPGFRCGPCHVGYLGDGVTCQAQCRRPCPLRQTCVGPDQCTCAPGYEGRRCDRPTCEPKCLHGGVCVRPNLCRCFSGYTGAHCQTSLCASSCQHGGRCIGNNRCLCPYGYSGSQCQILACRRPCQNGGRCVGSNRCRCLPGYQGQLCETPTCSPACLNGGTCLRPGVCACPPGYQGRRCEEALCSPSCQNRGRCLRFNTCKCPTGFTGLRCETPVCRPTCMNQGRCVGPNQCMCTSGWTGHRCDQPVCRPSCKNGGLCVMPDICSCPRGYTGADCSRRLRRRYRGRYRYYRG